VADLERGARPWLKAVTPGSPRVSRPRGTWHAYRGINVLLLWGEAIDRGYSAPLWMTLPPGPRARRAVSDRCEHGHDRRLRRRNRPEGDRRRGNDIERAIPIPEGLYRLQRRADLEPSRRSTCHNPKPLTGQRGADRLGRGVRRRHRRHIRHGGEAPLQPKLDVIQLPVPEAFRDAEKLRRDHGARADALDGAPLPAQSRVRRHTRFGDTGYAREELVASSGPLSCARI